MFLVRRKGGVTYGRDESTSLLLPACTPTVAEVGDGCVLVVTAN